MSPSLPEGHPLAGLIASVALAAALWAFPISLVLLRLYRRRVIAGMMARGTEAAAHTDRGEGATRPASPLQSGFEGLEAVLRQRVRATAAVYAVAGLGFALVMGASYMAAAGSGVQPIPLLIVTWNFAWPAVLSVALVSAGSWGDVARQAAGYFGILILLGIVAMARSDDLSAAELFALWVVLNGPASAVLGLFLSRPVRAVGPLVLGFLLVATTGAALALFVTATAELVPRMVGEIGAALGLGAPLLLVGVVLAGVVALAPVGYVSGRQLGRWYDRKRISDESVTVDALWLVFAVAQSTVLVSGSGPPWLLSGVLAFVVYKILTLAGFRIFRRRGPAPGAVPRLLVLRAFSLGWRGERLFTAVTKHWRHVGSVQLIAGPDLATSTIEPHEFLDFLHGCLARRFINGPQDLERSIAQADLDPDPDGRFRVNEFFCHDDVWRTVFARLLALSDAVLMDLRGFTRENTGLAFELRELVRVAPLRRVVLLVDAATELSYVKDLAGEAWRSRPGAAGDPEPPHLEFVHAAEAREYRKALGALAAALLPAHQPA